MSFFPDGTSQQPPWRFEKTSALPPLVGELLEARTTLRVTMHQKVFHLESRSKPLLLDIDQAVIRVADQRKHPIV